MSRKTKQENISKKVSEDIENINIGEIKKTIKNEDNDEFEYQYFCDKYTNADFEKQSIEKLKMIYINGKGLLEQYYITNNKTCSDSKIMQLQYIINHITYNLNLKNLQQAEKLNKRMNSTVEEIKNIENESQKEAEEIKDLKSDMKSIVTTIISIILTISIIPTAVAGIEKVSANYILPFLSSIVLFGIIMIAFVYSIYQDKLKKSTWIIIATSMIICIMFWFSSFKINIQNKKEENIVLNNITERTD